MKRGTSRNCSQPGIKDLNGLVREFITLANTSNQAFMDDIGKLINRTSLTQLLQPPKNCGCSADCDCEDDFPKCYEVELEAYPGERQVIPLRFVNRVNRTVRFSASITPWQSVSDGKPQGPAQVQPESFTLEPNASRIIQVLGDFNEQFLPGNTYESQLAIQSEFRKETICLNVRMKSMEEVACSIEYLANPKFGGHCHSWRDHFYQDRPDWVKESR